MDEQTLDDRVATYLRGGWGRPPRKDGRTDCEWYALSVAAQREAMVAASLSEHRFPIFLPMLTRLRDGQRHMEPLLPGYVFLLCCPADFADVLGIEDVAGFVRYTRNDGVAWPVAFPCQDILRFQVDERAGLFDRTRNVRPPRYLPKKGELVRITAGPYFDFIATVLASPQGDRCKLLIQHEAFEAPRKRTEDVAHLTAA